jgi:ribbon-helix-helix protein
MKSLVVKRSIVVGGHKTSVSLEDAFWSGLKELPPGVLRHFRNWSVRWIRSATTPIFRPPRLLVLAFYRSQASDEEPDDQTRLHRRRMPANGDWSLYFSRHARCPSAQGADRPLIAGGLRKLPDEKGLEWSHRHNLADNSRNLRARTPGSRINAGDLRLIVQNHIQ